MLLHIIVLLNYLLPLSFASTTFFTTTTTRYFGDTDKQITNVSNYSIRPGSIAITHKLTSPSLQFMVGITDFELVNSKFMDFEVYNSTPAVNGVTTVTYRAFPGSALNVMTFQSIASASGKN